METVSGEWVGKVKNGGLMVNGKLMMKWW